MKKMDDIIVERVNGKLGIRGAKLPIPDIPNNAPKPLKNKIPMNEDPFIEEFIERAQDLAKDIKLNWSRLSYEDPMVNMLMKTAGNNIQAIVDNMRIVAKYDLLNTKEYKSTNPSPFNTTEDVIRG